MKFLFVAGARPNFMKVAPLIQEIRRRASPDLSYQLVHTGQHYDAKMSDIFFEELGIPAPDVNLAIGSGTHAVQTANVMLKFEPVVEQIQPDWVVVVGDVNSTLACTLVCAKLGIRVAHVEAGLRSFDREMPEEVNRVVTDALADLLLTPSEDANENLAREGVPSNKIEMVGNVMIDSLLANLNRARASTILATLGLKRGGFVYATLHRPSNVDSDVVLGDVIQHMRILATNLPVVFPMHPRTRIRCDHFGISLPGNSRLLVIEPVGYHDSLCLAENARFVLTDSGGLQEETTYFGTPCLTLRPNTERPVTLTMGTNRLTDPVRLALHISDYMEGRLPTRVVPPLWDGRTAERVIDRLVLAG